MTKAEWEIDEIDRQLFALESRALSLGQQNLARAIKIARSESYRLLPESRRKELES